MMRKYARICANAWRMAISNSNRSQVMEYVPPFHFKLNEDGSLVKDQAESASPMLVLVFKQVALETFRNKGISLFL